MATHSSTLAQKIPWTEETGVHGAAKSRTRLSDFTSLRLNEVIRVKVQIQKDQRPYKKRARPLSLCHMRTLKRKCPRRWQSYQNWPYGHPDLKISSLQNFKKINLYEILLQHLELTNTPFFMNITNYPIIGILSTNKDQTEKEMATHSSSLAWKIPWTEKRGRLQSMGSQRVGHN